MAINHMEQVVVSLLIQRLLDLKQEDELFDLSREEEGYGNKEYPKDIKLQRISVKALFDRYPTYELTKKLLEFGRVMVGFLDDPSLRSGDGRTGPRMSTIHVRTDVLEQNGFQFAHLDERAVYYAATPDGIDQRVAAFSLKIHEVFVDFDLFLPQEKIKGIGDQIYSNNRLVEVGRNFRQPPPFREPELTREQINDTFDRRVVSDITMWATHQAMSLLTHLRNQRRKKVSLDNLVLNLDISATVMPEPKKEETPKEEGPGARTTAA